MLGIECFFRFTSREHKDSILNCYEGIQQEQPLQVNNHIEDAGEELFNDKQ